MPADFESQAQLQGLQQDGDSGVRCQAAQAAPRRGKANFSLLKEVAREKIQINGEACRFRGRAGVPRYRR